jgi:hypothetical protein
MPLNYHHSSKRKKHKINNNADAALTEIAASMQTIYFCTANTNSQVYRRKFPGVQQGKYDKAATISPKFHLNHALKIQQTPIPRSISVFSVSFFHKTFSFLR